VANVEDAQQEEDGYVFTCTTQKKGLHYVTLDVCSRKIEFLIDPGANVTVIDSETYKKIGQPQLDRNRAKVFAYGGKEPLPVLGKFHTQLESAKKIIDTDIVVMANTTGNLLSGTNCEALGLITVNIAAVTKKDETSEYQDRYPKLFAGVGKLKDYKAHIHIDPEVRPIAQPHRRIPFHLRQKVEKELERLQELDIIERVQGPTPWVSPATFVTKKSGALRLCVDMRQANTAVQRERHPGPTLEDLVADLNGATVFSVIDMREGFHQIELDVESRDITCFSTHVGNFRYKCLIYGLSSAPELFQKVIEQTIDGVPGVRNIADDVIV
jgi:hypothetical protein